MSTVVPTYGLKGRYSGKETKIIEYGGNEFFVKLTENRGRILCSENKCKRGFDSEHAFIQHLNRNHGYNGNYEKECKRCTRPFPTTSSDTRQYCSSSCAHRGNDSHWRRKDDVSVGSEVIHCNDGTLHVWTVGDEYICPVCYEPMKSPRGMGVHIGKKHTEHSYTPSESIETDVGTEATS